MSVIPTADLCDVWEPTDHIQTDASLHTPTYTKVQSSLPANFRELTANQRAMAGLDFTQPMRRLFLYGARRASTRAIYVNRTDGTAWRENSPPTYHVTPVSPGHFEILLTADLAPPAEIKAAYP